MPGLAASVSGTSQVPRRTSVDAVRPRSVPGFPLDGWAAATAVPALTPVDRDTARERVSCFRRRFDESGCTKRFSSPRKLRRSARGMARVASETTRP